MQLPANDSFQYKAGQYVEFILRDGDRRSYSMANAPHRQRELIANDQPAIELHLRHMPGGKFTDHVFSTLKERDILRIEGPFGSFFLREDSIHSPCPSCCWPRAPALRRSRRSIEQMQHKGMTQPTDSLLGLPQPRRPVPARLGAAGGRADAAAALHARCCPSRVPKTTGPAAPAWSTRR